jgi:catechol 2,3-dioxygenase-like lactoylglutathione lyase family enzyme
MVTSESALVVFIIVLSLAAVGLVGYTALTLRRINPERQVTQTGSEPETPPQPSLVCKDVDKTYDYFTSVLGFAGTGKWAGPDGQTMHAMAILPTKNGEASVMFGPLAMATSPMGGDLGEFGENLKKEDVHRLCEAAGIAVIDFVHGAKLADSFIWKSGRANRIAGRRGAWPGAILCPRRR